MPMDDYYSLTEIDDSLDDDTVFKQHVVREDEDLMDLDNMLKIAFSTID